MIKKTSIAIIAISLAFSTVFAEENFTPFHRLGTWYLNVIPGLGSAIIMDDWTGAAIQWGLSGGGIGLMIAAGATEKEECVTYVHIKDPNNKSEKCYAELTKVGANLLAAGAIMWFSSFLVYNTYRSITYDKPGSIAYNKYGNFSVAVLPNRNMNFNAYLMYNKAF